MQHFKKHKKAFTLMELMIVIAILGVLTTLMTGNFLTSIKRSRDAQRKNDLSTIQRALEMYYEDNKAYPANVGVGSSAGYNTFGTAFCHPNGCDTKTYMQKLPNDPVSGREYRYVSGTTSAYAIYACLENKQSTVTTYEHTPADFCSPTDCKDKDGADQKCIFAVSDSNSSP